jgi:hypothetical protein
MTYIGRVHNGQIELPPDTVLPEGAVVRVETVDEPDPADCLSDLAVDGGPPDLAAEHDHYVYGTPKRGA